MACVFQEAKRVCFIENVGARRCKKSILRKIRVNTHRNRPYGVNLPSMETRSRNVTETRGINTFLNERKYRKQREKKKHLQKIGKTRHFNFDFANNSNEKVLERERESISIDDELT